MSTFLEVRRGAYHDSVALMVVSQAALAVDGVEAALVAMATELNLEVLADLGFDAADVQGAGPNDMLIALRGETEEALVAARGAVEAALVGSSRAGSSAGLGAAPPPRTVGSGARRDGFRLALVSVPGPDAFVEAMDALRAGLHVMVFSDNVPVEQEVTLKEEAARRGLLVMGPDCGTAVIGGVGLGFANVVRPGPVAIVGASGTGIQQVASLLDDAGVGVRHAIGVGGRDLSAEVGAASTLAALGALDGDPGAEAIVVISKPPDPAVAERVAAAAQGCATPVVLGFVGRGRDDLTAVTRRALEALGLEPSEPRRWPAPAERGHLLGHVRGIFSGGTLCDEAMAVVADSLGGPVLSNIPLDPGWGLDGVAGDLAGLDAHWMVDFGDDAFTRGRPHPMIDNRVRVERIVSEGRDGRADNLLLIDVVLGHGAHPDPAADLAPAIAEARAAAAAAGRQLDVVVSLCGTRGDPQGLARQTEALVDAGASVHLSNAAAAREAAELVTGGA